MIPDDICGFCYHPKDSSLTCNRPDCPRKTTPGKPWRMTMTPEQERQFEEWAATQVNMNVSYVKSAAKNAWEQSILVERERCIKIIDGEKGKDEYWIDNVLEIVIETIKEQ